MNRLLKTRARTFCGYGDSRIALCGDGVVQYDNSFFGWAQAITGVDALELGNDGVAGETTTQVLARIGNVLAKQPDVCFIMCGVNDFTAGVDNFALCCSNLQTMFATLSTAGIYCVYLSNTGYSLAAGLVKNNLASVDWFVFNYFRNNPTQGRIVDFMTPTTIPSTGFFVANGSYDGLHQTNYGALLEGNYDLKNTFAELFGPLRLANTPYDIPSVSPNSVQVNLNPLMNGAAGTVNTGITGQVATSYSASRTGGLTAVGSVANNKQSFAVTATAAGDVLTMSSVDISGNTSVGDYLSAACKLNITNPVGLRRIRMYQTVNNFSLYSMWGADSGQTSFDLPSVIPPLSPKTGFIQRTDVRQCYWNIEFQFSGAGGCNVDISNVTVIKSPTNTPTILPNDLGGGGGGIMSFPL